MVGLFGHALLDAATLCRRNGLEGGKVIPSAETHPIFSMQYCNFLLISAVYWFV